MTEIALVVIPEEAEGLIPLIRGISNPSAWLVQYSAPVTRKTLHFNDLTYFSIPSFPKGWKAPSWLRIELGIFAGRLYFDWSEYDALLSFLGFEGTDAVEMQMNGSESSNDSEYTTASMGTSVEQLGDRMKGLAVNHRSSKQKKSKIFTEKPLAFLHEWISCRRKGQDFTNTPMGYICEGKSLTQDHHFFARSK